jgi:hypothetical protein
MEACQVPSQLREAVAFFQERGMAQTMVGVGVGLRVPMGVGVMVGVFVMVGVLVGEPGVGVLVIVAVGIGLPTGVAQQEVHAAGVAGEPGMAELPLNTNWPPVTPNRRVWL